MNGRGAERPLFRPPAEAASVILRVSYGCPHPACAFCGMYRDGAYEARPAEDVSRDLRRLAREQPETRRIFLADGDALQLGLDRLRALLDELSAAFPDLARVNSYANGSSILALGPEGLSELKRRKLHTLYMGLESGDEELLKRMGKKDTAENMVRAGVMAQAGGLHMSVMVLLGLSGRAGSARHAHATASAVNRMQPRLLSALRVIPIPGTPLERWHRTGAFEMLTEREEIMEMREMIAGFELSGTVFRANHASNAHPMEARFPKDKEALLKALDALLASGRLDRLQPSPSPLWM
ncbi:MAG: radical SAM protein [Kiritimatiellae bacterium]|nr:radical SAM protein [Kiritimatiellia bacterium]